MGRPLPPLIRAMPERKRFFSVDVFPNVLQQVHRLFLHCPSLLFQTLSADNVLKAFSILQGTPSKSAELGNNYHRVKKNVCNLLTNLTGGA